MVPKVKEGVRLRREEFGGLLFTNRTPVLALNNDALAIWDLIDGNRTVLNIVDILARTGREPRALSALVQQFIEAGYQLDLLEIESSDPAAAGKQMNSR